MAQARWEIHRRYLDVQYIVQGGERIGFAPYTEGLKVDEAYDPQRDIAFYFASGVLVPVPAGMFAILTPHELHSPGLVVEDTAAPGDVLKVVVKCRWE
jgi:YhcH/YjgK/YiaL family protein